MSVFTASPPLVLRAATIGLLCVAALPLLVFADYKLLGWFLLSAAVFCVGWVYPSRFSKHMLVLISALALLGLVPINTDISYEHFAVMGSVLVAVVVLPYLVTTKWFKETVITFPLRTRSVWGKRQVAYLAMAAVASYLLLPYYLHTTGSYLNWDVPLDTDSLVRFFIGTNGLGIWDELFFVGVCLALLKQHIPFVWANIAQATLWTIFLFELGFQGWGPIVVFIFALTQGYMFKDTKSFSYIIAVHLTIDLILSLTLIHLHHPEYLRIFITSPL